MTLITYMLYTHTTANDYANKDNYIDDNDGSDADGNHDSHNNNKMILIIAMVMLWLIKMMIIMKTEMCELFIFFY